MGEKTSYSNKFFVDGTQTHCDHVLDTSGLRCPLPLLRLKKALVAMESNKTIKVLSTDAASVLDFGVFSDQSGNRILNQYEDKGIFYYVIKKK